MKSLGILWAQYGPYHFARARSLQEHVKPASTFALEQANFTGDYAWKRSANGTNVITICPNSVVENLSFGTVFRRTRLKLSELGIEVCFLPSYSPKQSLAALFAAKSLGIRTVMMNESHAGTARARGPSLLIKRQLVRLFDAALVGGTPQKRYFASLGFPEDKIFTGYDAVDNDYFASRADEIRSRADEHRLRFGLPARYFLSLGRFVAKKNLTTLIQAYRKFLDSRSKPETHLVMVGSGVEESRLRSLCAELRLPICEHPSDGSDQRTNADCSVPAVHFYSFRQTEENAVFYALADAFILPSLWEEWGLVVNEAMAAGLPVVVSENAGCAEDLLQPGWPKLNDNAGLAREVEAASATHRLRQNGFSFDPNSADELARVMGLLDSNADLRKAMGNASRRIVEKFSCRNFAENALKAAHAAMGSPAPVQKRPAYKVE